MRITNLNTTEQLISNIFDRRYSLDQVRQEIASGIKVDVGSKDPGRAGSIVNLQQTITRIDRHTQRIAYTTGILEHQEATLNSAEEILIRAQEIAEQGANEALSFEDRRLLADEAFQLRDQLVSLANTTYQGKYLYGVADDDDPPFDAQTYTQSPTNTAERAYVRYVFDAELGTAYTPRQIAITDDDSIQVVSSGDEVFSHAIGAMERLGRALSGYRTNLDVTTGLPDGTGTAFNPATDYALQTADIRSSLDALGSARTDDIIRERSSVGARIARTEQVTEILAGLKVSTETARSSVQDSDIFEASAKFSNLQTSLQALLASGAQINNLSLLNYI